MQPLHFLPQPVVSPHWVQVMQVPVRIINPPQFLQVSPVVI